MHESELRALFECVPHGLAIVDREGTIVAMNNTFRTIVRAETGAPGAARSCCELLGCDHTQDACLLDALAASERGLSDVPVELPGQTGAVSLSGAPLDDGELLIVELRGVRPVAVPDASGPRPIRLRVLGRMRVETAEGIVTGGWVDERPGQLLKFLVATRGRVVAVEDIAEAIWPTAEFATVGTVRHLVHVLRRRLEPDRRPGGAASYIVSSRGGYTLDQERVVIDADEFEEGAVRALTAFSAGDDAVEPALETALARYDGNFLGDELYADWAHAERERLRGLAERLLWALSDLALARGEITLATTYGERLAALEPFDSDIQRQLIVLLLHDGRRGRALRQYQAFALRLQRALGEQPDFSLDELMHEGPVPRGVAQGRWRREQRQVRRSHG